MFHLRFFGFLAILFFSVAGLWGLTTAATTEAAVTTNVITVTTTGDLMIDDGFCSLREALYNANTNTQDYADCEAGSATQTDIIVLTSGQTYNLTKNFLEDDDTIGQTGGDLDIVSNGLPLDLLIETDSTDPANIVMTLGNERVMEIHPNATVAIDNIEISGGTSSDFGAGIYHQGAYLGLTNVTLTGNNANAGGGIYNNTGVLLVDNSTIEQNNGALGGAGIVNSSGTVTVTNSTLSSNFATGGSGGGISNGGTLYVGEGTTFTGNFAGFMGGGIYNQSGGMVHLHNATLSGEMAEDGAALYNDEGTVIIENSSLVQATAQNSGGAIYNRDVMTLTNTLVQQNTAVGSHGGGIASLASGTIALAGVIFDRNEALNGFGGGVYSASTNAVHFTGDDVQFWSNKAQNGGGMYGTGHIFDGNFSGNTATGLGGGLYITTYFFLEVTLVEHNEAIAGGGIYGTRLEAQEVNIYQNHAINGSGGGLYVSYVDMEYGRITENTATEDGGGIYANNTMLPNAVARINRMQISNNNSQNNGGGVWIDRHFEFGNVTISDNTAFNVGGGLHIEPTGFVTATNITLAMNPLGWDLYKAGELTLQNSIISNVTFNCNLVATPINSLGHNISNDDTCNGLDEPTDMTETDPVIGPLAHNGGGVNTHALLDGSPAIGAGNTAVCAASPINGIDQRGFLRDSVACDIGAYEYGLTIAIGLAGDGVGNVNGKGLNCGDGGADCTIKHPHGDTFPLEANPATGSDFIEWSGDLTGIASPVDWTMDNTTHITATFDLIRHDLTVNKAGTGAGLVTSDPAGINCGATCTAEFVENSIVTLTADPSAGSEFEGWTGAVISDDLSIQVTMDEAQSVTATFTLLPNNFLLTVNKVGMGTVTSNPAGINCGNTCAAGFVENTVIELTAVAAEGYTFTGWSGDATGDMLTIQVTMDAAQNVTATFTADEEPETGYRLYLPIITRN